MSTKFVIEPDTQRFYDALSQSPNLRWLHVHSAGADRQIYIDLMARGVTVSTASGANARGGTVSTRWTLSPRQKTAATDESATSPPMDATA